MRYGLRLGMVFQSARASAFGSGRLAALAILVAVALPMQPPQARAQWGDNFFDTQRMDPYAAPRRRAYRDDGYADRAPSRRYAPPEPQRQFFWPWEERSQQAQPRPEPVPRTAPRRTVTPRVRPPAPQQGAPATSSSSQQADAARQRSVRPAPVAPTPPAPKTAPNVQVAVFGDSLASFLAKGLDGVFAENPDVAVLDRSRGDSGMVRKDIVDWPKAAEEFLKANPKVSYALFMVGVNDRQAIRENDQSLEPLGDKWRDVYAGRIDAVAKVFAEYKIPLIWVGVPPLRFEMLNKDLVSINDIARERMQKAGQTYVDIWPGFADERNRYTPVGPDVDGQRVTLRAGDGIHFTNPGARKLAHFADVELKRLMSANGSLPAEAPAVATTPAGTPGDGSTPGLDDIAAIDRRITAMLPSLPEPPGIPTLPVKPAAGPVVPLGRAETSPGGTLATGRPREGDAAGTVERTLQRGTAPLSQPGRADDFKWPPS